MSGAEPVFVVRQLSQLYGPVRALDDVSLTICAGEQVALIGPSGAGKSTLIGLLNGTLTPTEGEVVVFGQDLARLPPSMRRALQRQVGTIYQQFHLVDTLRVVHNVNAGNLGRWSLLKALVSLAWPLEVQQATWALARVGIAEKLYARTGQLSGGQQQRVAIARVLVQDPRAILADEPIASLDPERGREIMDLLCGISQQTGKTLVASLHAVDVVRTYFERIIGLRAGQIQFDVSPTELTEPMLRDLYRIESDDPVTLDARSLPAALGQQ